MNGLNLFNAFVCVLILSMASLRAESSIERVEPPFWWTGFENKALQLLVHGENISMFEPQVDGAGITLEKIIKVTSPNYVFLDLKIGEKAVAGKFNIIFIHEDGRTIIHPYELKVRRQGSAARKGFDSSDIIYLITPDRFANSKPENDAVEAMVEGLDRADKDGRHGGDIQGIIDHLDYIDAMGFTALWPTPMLENNQPRTSYHGYAITDFYQQDPRFGSNEDFINLVKQARARGMGVIMDMVANHAGSEHWWMKDLPSYDWLNFYPGEYVQSHHMRNTIQDPYGAQWDRDRFSGGWFDKAMPDLNQKNPLMANYLIQNAIWWVEYADLAGIRMDTYSYPDMDFMAEWSRRIMVEYPEFNLVGEENVTNVTLVSYWQRGKVNKNGYKSFLPSLMDFPLQDALVKGLQEEEGWASGLVKLYEILSLDNQYPDPNSLVILSDNHDMNRLYSVLGEDIDLYKMAMAYTLTMRGIPQIYYGSEILKTSPEARDDGMIRSDFPGGWAGDKVNGFTGDGLSVKQKSAQEFVRNLANWRKTKKVIHSGELKHFIPENGTYVYFRYNEQDKIMVVLNKNKAGMSLDLKRFGEMLEGHTMARDVITGQDVDLSHDLNLAPRSVMVLDIK